LPSFFIWQFYKRLCFLVYFRIETSLKSWLECKVRDSWGSSVAGETLYVQCTRWLTARSEESKHIKFAKTAFYLKKIERRKKIEVCRILQEYKK
jgi:hypothetical protein